ncbi:hypothetical protein KA068_01860 [Candidatus Saccharibacteria bacterium]|jgi:hypothetical protein|nr:hypothetical protein [Candidatus Saccharibacteria bacterium]
MSNTALKAPGFLDLESWSNKVAQVSREERETKTKQTIGLVIVRFGLGLPEFTVGSAAGYLRPRFHNKDQIAVHKSLASDKYKESGGSSAFMLCALLKHRDQGLSFRRNRPEEGMFPNDDLIAVTDRVMNTLKRYFDSTGVTVGGQFTEGGVSVESFNSVTHFISPESVRQYVDPNLEGQAR